MHKMCHKKRKKDLSYITEIFHRYTCLHCYLLQALKYLAGNFSQYYSGTDQ